MGTRHLTAVVLDGEYKIAQYGQWDGYPQGQGKTVLQFIKKWNRPRFETALRNCRWITKDEHKATWSATPGYVDTGDGLVSCEIADKHSEMFPELSRDTGAKILQLVQSKPEGLKLYNSIAFAGNSLMCEFAYILDLDKNVLEFYKGFNKEPLNKGDRFYGVPELEISEDYHPVRLVKAYALNQLPTVEQMVEDLEPLRK